MNRPTGQGAGQILHGGLDGQRTPVRCITEPTRFHRAAFGVRRARPAWPWALSVPGGGGQARRGHDHTVVPTADPEREFLVAYDYGTGGLWAVVVAPSRQAILSAYPEVVVVDERPAWMSAEKYEQMRGDPLWLDDMPPQGLFRVVLADRERT
jgi:hypothetical protein